ncbi:MAG: hypothetical protein QGF09_12535, partial [Rhodospirillales bacterium]|nr:hypothetical protein [Rhodospirillales bacterium]
MVELHKIDPRPHLPRDAITIGRSYSSTREALEAGNYPVALSLAGEDDPESLAMAAIMCGAVVPGLALLQSIARRTSMARLYEGFALWCLEDRDGAAEILGGLVGTEAGGPARGLEKAVNRPALDVVLLSMPGSDKAASYENVPGFRIFRRSLDADGFGTSMADLLAGLPDRAEVDFLINLDAFGPYLPLGAGLDGPPLVSWSSDYDFFFATRHGDYAASTVVIANSAAEHDEINAIHSARVAAFPGHDSYGWSTAFPPPAGLKEVDVLFTGRAFVPYMRDKAQFLFRLATLDDAAARIAIHDDYMNDERYLKAMASARFVA